MYKYRNIRHTYQSESIMTKKIENIELDYLTIDDYQELKQAMIIAYQAIPDPYW